MGPWSPTSWRGKHARQQVAYRDAAEADEALSRVKSMGPLVHVREIAALRRALGEVSRGRSFVVHGGECAERFVDATEARVSTMLVMLLSMSKRIATASKQPVVTMGRIAGQYAKPRSRDFETIDGVDIPSYRGDLINDVALSPEARLSCPMRMVDAHVHAARALDAIRRFLSRRDAHGLSDMSFFTSHEALHLPFEEAFVAPDDGEGTCFDFSAHFLWVGDRTRHPDEAHVEFLRGIQNPVGVKIGPTCDADTLSCLIERLNPTNVPGRLVLISRYGRDAVDRWLARHVLAARRTGLEVVWMCDPMHGNTVVAPSGIKTRALDAVFSELEQTFFGHRALGSRLGGIHFECTTDAVTECIPDASYLAARTGDLSVASGCDPRLNAEQVQQLADRLATLLAA